MTRRGFGRAFAALLLLLGLSGCWDQRSVAERAIVMAVSVSRQHRWTFLFPNVTTTISSLSSIQSAEQFFTITVRADSWAGARHSLQRRANRQISLGDLELLLVDRDMTMAQVSKVVGAINMGGTIPASMWVAAATGDPAKLFKQDSPQSFVPVFYLSSYFNCEGCHAAVIGVHEWQWWDRQGTPGTSAVLPLMAPRPEGASVRQLLVYAPTGKPQLMPRTVTQGYEYLESHVIKGRIPVVIGRQSYEVADVRDRAHTTVRLQGGTVVATISIAANGIVVGMPIDTMVSHRLEVELGHAVGLEILKRCVTAIDWANKTHTDPFGYAKTASWRDNSVPPARLSRLPIHGDISVHVVITGEGVSE